MLCVRTSHPAGLSLWEQPWEGSCTCKAWLSPALPGHPCLRTHIPLLPVCGGPPCTHLTPWGSSTPLPLGCLGLSPAIPGDPVLSTSEVCPRLSYPKSVFVKPLKTWPFFPAGLPSDRAVPVPTMLTRCLRFVSGAPYSPLSSNLQTRQPEEGQVLLNQQQVDP